jgi:SPP1 gp7 family putative phage head morphogenesis protein
MSISSIADRKKESNKVIGKIEDIAIKTKKLTQKLKKDAIDEALKQNEKNKPYTASILTAKAVDGKMKKIINSNKKSFDDFIKDTERYLSKNYSIDLTKNDLAAIARKRSLVLDDLAVNTNILAQDLKEIMTRNLSKGMTTRELSKNLADLYPAFERNAETIVRTGLGRTFSDINVSKFQQLKFNWYIWSGPNDAVTRERPCKSFVNKKFKAERLPELSSIRQSLYNCRHAIIPITDEEADNYEEGNI